MKPLFHFGGVTRQCLKDLKGSAKKIIKNDDGTIAVEMALITPIVLAAMLTSAELGFKVFKHQKIAAAAYSSASYLQDQMATGEYDKLRPSVDLSGMPSDSDLVRTAKLILQDASGLPIKLESININAYCACPKVSRSNGPEGEDPLADQTSFYKKQPIQSGSGSNVCPSKCESGYDARVIAEIDVSYTAKSVLGPNEVVTESIITRLR